jgi:carbon storage regulator
MLVLSRKVGERIRIGDAITVTVVRVTGGGVRIGIEAPAEMPVIREELHHQLEKSDQRVKGADPGDGHLDQPKVEK